MADWTAALALPPITKVLLALMAGAGLGFVYFGGLWWTIRRLAATQRVGLLFLGSFLMRTTIVVAGFYLIAFRPVSQGSWLLILVALAGFVLMRLLLIRRWGPISPVV